MININNIIETTKELIAIPSQGGIDNPDAILNYLEGKCVQLDLPVEMLEFDDKKVGLAVSIINNPNNPTYLLCAVVDTAPIGDPARWDTDPFVPTIKDGWLYGCGVSDSKIGAAILLSLAEYAKQSGKNFIIYFDADEHTGKFYGVQALIKRYPNISGGMLTYPGNKKLIIGCRGFYRAVAHVRGKMGHSGSRTAETDNAILTACDFIQSLSLDITINTFPLPPKLSVTAIHGGVYFSTIPDKVEINVDIRTTSDFDESAAEKFLKNQAAKFNGKIEIKEFQRWPAYMLDKKSHIRVAFETALKQSGSDIPSTVSGMANGGNLFAMHGIEVTSGFGVAYKNAHAANECIDLSSIGKVTKVYERLIDSI